MKRSHVVLGVAVLLAVTLFNPPSEGATSDRCLPGTPAISHLAGGAPAKAKATRVACGVETGFYTGETGIAVTKQGSIWFSAADWEWAMVHSKDNGRTWQREAAEGPQAMPGCYVVTSPVTCLDSEADKNATVADAYLWVDPTTGKLFWSKTYGGLADCSSLSMTPDDGETWQATPEFACPGADYEKIAGGPAPAGADKPVGYPSVLYGCTNGPAPIFIVGPSRPCYKSLDAGKTWGFAGVPLPSPLAPGCLHIQEAQTVGPDGTIFLPVGCGSTNLAGLVRLAISKDEGLTWSYANVPTGAVGNAAAYAGVTAAVDAAGNLYVVWRGADQKPYLAVSKDQGASWNGPLLIAPPGVASGGPTPQVVAQKAGHIAIGYYGWTKDAQHLNGYLSESFNATARTPLLQTGLLNDPSNPLYFPVDSGTLPRNDYLGVTMAPDGTPWVALVKLLSAKPDVEGYIPSTGFAGHLE
jgi:hypothetical protein